VVDDPRVLHPNDRVVDVNAISIAAIATVIVIIDIDIVVIVDGIVVLRFTR
jgi:hypothetical protein